MSSARSPIWVFRALPLDPELGVIVPVWLATQTRPIVETLAGVDGWVSFNATSDAAVRTGLSFGNVPVPGEFALGVRFRTDALDLSILAGKSALFDVLLEGYGIGIRPDATVEGYIDDGSTRDAITSSPLGYADSNFHTLVVSRIQTLALPPTYTIFLYFDGVQVASMVSSVSSVSVESSLMWGRDLAGLQPFTGSSVADIERVCLFVGSHNISQVNAVMNAVPMADAMDVAPASLVGAWPLNEGNGITAFNIAPGFHSQLGSTATLIEGAEWGGVLSAPPGPLSGVVSSPFSVRGSVAVGKAIASRGLPSLGDIVYGNPNGKFDAHLDYSWYKRIIEVRKGFTDQIFDNMERVWIGEADEPRADRDTNTVPLRGVEERFDVPLQPPERHYQPGYEPYVNGDGVNNQIAFGNNLNRTTGSFTFAGAFLIASAPGSDQAIYGKKNALSAGAAGYSIALSAAGVLNGRVSDGVDQVLTSSGGLNVVDGLRHTFAVAVNKGTNQQHLYVDRVLVDTQDISAVGSLSNAVNLVAMATASGSNFFAGQLERLIQMNGAGAGVINAIHDALDEPYADDVDASGFGHYVPLTENSGTTATDTSPNGFNGTLTGEANPDAYWTGLQNGTPEIEGQPWPLYLGLIPHVNLVLLDPIKGVFHINEPDILTGGLPSIQDVSEVRVAGLADVDEDTTTSGDIWTNPPPLGEWRWRNQLPHGALLRINANLAGELTATFRTIGLNSSGNPDQILRRLKRRIPGVAAAYDGFAEFLAATEVGHNVGIGWQQETTVGSAITEFIQGWGFSWTVDPRTQEPTGLIRIRVFQPRDVSAVTPVATLALNPVDSGGDIEEFGFDLDPRPRVYERVRARYRRFYGWQPLGQLLPAVPLDIRLELSKEWRQVEVTAATPGYTGTDPALFLSDAVHEFDIPVNQLSGSSESRSFALAEALRRLELWAKRPRLVTVELSGYLFEFWLGDVIEIVGPRFGHENGKKYIVVSVDDDSSNSGSRLTLWGGFDSA